ALYQSFRFAGVINGGLFLWRAARVEEAIATEQAIEEECHLSSGQRENQIGDEFGSGVRTHKPEFPKPLRARVREIWATSARGNTAGSAIRMPVRLKVGKGFGNRLTKVILHIRIGIGEVRQFPSERAFSKKMGKQFDVRIAYLCSPEIRQRPRNCDSVAHLKLLEGLPAIQCEEGVVERHLNFPPQVCRNTIARTNAVIHIITGCL